MSELKAIQVSQSEMAVRLACAFYKTNKPEVDPDVAMSELMRRDQESAKCWLAAAEVAILYMGECLGAECEFLPQTQNDEFYRMTDELAEEIASHKPPLRGKKVQA